jgi:hypothetical protein
VSIKQNLDLQVASLGDEGEAVELSPELEESLRSLGYIE